MINILNLKNKKKPKINKDAIPKESSLRWIRKIKSYHSNRTLPNNQINYSKAKFNLDGLGDIKLAKQHKEANRPLKKIKDFNEKTKFCPCCSLPVRDKECVTKFNFCENTDNYAECGRGISLYFSFFRFSLFILALTFLSICLPTIYLTRNYTNELIDICMKIYEKDGINISNNFPECINFIGVEGISEFFIKGRGLSLIFNSINQRQYRQAYNRIQNIKTNTNINIDKVIVNYSLIYFINLITFFIINVLYTILLYAHNKQYDLSVTSPSDFTVIIRNLDSAFNIFWNKINKINKLINNNGIISTSQISQNISNNDELELKKELGLENFPLGKEINIKDGFNNFIKNKICESSKGEKFQIQKINICYKINEVMRIQEKIQDIKSKMLKIEHDPKQIAKNKKYNLINEKRKYFYNYMSFLGIRLLYCNLCEKSISLTAMQIDQKILEQKLKNSLKQIENLTNENFSGVVFVSFNTMDEQEKFLKLYPKSFLSSLLISLSNLKYFLCCCIIMNKSKNRYILQKDIEVDEAPEPEDIIFENLQFSSKERFCRIFLIYCLSIIMIGLCFSIILGLNYYQINYQKINDKNKIFMTYLVSIAITCITFLLNFIFQICLGRLTKKEKQISMTNYYLSFSIKLTFFSFMTSGIVPILSNYYYDEQKNYNLLVTNMITMFLTNSFLTPIFWTFDLKYLLKRFNIFLIEKNGNSDLTQRELNTLYEFPDMKISYKYSYIAKTLLMSFLYIPIFPFGILISLLGFILAYSLEKYNFSNQYKRPEMLNSKICEFYSNYFIVNFFVLGMGNYIFIYENYENKIWPIFIIILFGFLLLIPYNLISKLDIIGINESQIKKEENYDNSYFKFCNDYERTNPITKKEGMRNFLKKLWENGLINQFDYNSIFNNIDKINLMETYCKIRKNFNNYLIQMALVGIVDKNKKNLNNNIINENSKNNKNLINNNETNINNNNEHFENKSKSNSSKNSNKSNNNLNLNLNISNDSNNDQNSNLNINNINKEKIDVKKKIKENNENNLYDRDKINNLKNLNIEETEINIPDKRRKSMFDYNNNQKKILHRYSNPFIFGIQINYDNFNSNCDLNNEIINNNNDNKKNAKLKPSKTIQIKKDNYKI